tara:strand:- start:24679 stop:26250 length:1572 start_codon:yes stop_codon:yes gene_type:complete
MINLNNIFKKGIISIYGYSYKDLPREIEKSKNFRINIFFKNNHLNRINNLNFLNAKEYYGYKCVSYGDGDVVFLDQDSVKSTCIGYPKNSRFVFISLRYFEYYFYIFIGLLRRKISNEIKIKGIIWLTISSKKIPWILIENLEVKTNSLSLSNAIGIDGLLNYLSKEKISYLVPRFYRFLPNLSSDNSDLDLLVDKNSVDKVINFLNLNSGDINIDIYTDIGLDYYGMPYFPPHKAKLILKRAIVGPGNSRVPNDYDSLLLLIYHVLYHKGFMSGIPSIFIIKNKTDYLNNKYLREISELNKNLNINLGDTLEELDDFMFEVGWRPAIDTLTKISEWNEWVFRYHIKKEKSKVPLYVLVLKNVCIGTKEEQDLLKECKRQKLKILDERSLSKDIQSKAITDIRGGVWNDSLSKNMEESDFYPGKIYLLWDCFGSRPEGFSGVKVNLRKKIDKHGPSFIHSSDNYKESLDYIQICMPEKLSYYSNQDLIIKNYSKFNIKRNKFSEIIPHLKTRIRLEIINLVSH